MKKTHIVLTIALIGALGLSIGVYAAQGMGIWDKIFNKDIDNITFDELKAARDELNNLKLSPEEFDEWGKKLKEAIIEKEKELPKTTNKNRT